MCAHYFSVIRNDISYFLTKSSSATSNRSPPTRLTRNERYFMSCAHLLNVNNKISYIPSLCFKVLVGNQTGTELCTANFKRIRLSSSSVWRH